MNTVQTKVAEQIAAINPKVEDEVVGVLVKRELTKRSDALVIVIDAMAKLELELKKMKPDMVFYDGDGTLAAESFSKKMHEDKKKLTEKITKYANAITKALDKGDFGDVYNLKNQKPSGSGDSPADDTASD